MKMNWNKSAVFVAPVLLVLAAALMGCSSEKPAAQAPAAAAPADSSPAPAAAGEQGEAAVAVTPAADIAGIWTQIAGEQARLDTAIQSGQLKDVHHLAFGIRDLVVALADKAKAATPAVGGKLDGMVAQVKASASKLDELGDAGNLSGTQAEYAKLQSVLASIKTVAGK